MDSIYVALKDLKDGYWLNTEYLSLLIALIAVFFGPLISYLTSKKTISTQLEIAQKEIKSKVLSNNRQDWINRLRNNISEFLSLILIGQLNQLEIKDKIALYEKLFTIRFRISLFINPKEDDHKELDELLEEALNEIMNPRQDKEHSRSIGNEIINISQIILKREWERVKNLD